MKRAVLLAAVFLCLGGCASETLELRLVDEKSRQPIAGAQVAHYRIQETILLTEHKLAKRVETDKDGKAVLENVGGGDPITVMWGVNHRLEIKRAGKGLQVHETETTSSATQPGSYKTTSRDATISPTAEGGVLKYEIGVMGGK